MKSQSGYSLAEVLVAAALITIGSTALISTFVDTAKVSNSATLKVTEEKQISQVIENIRSSIETYQSSFDGTAADRENALKVDQLPMAWSESVYTQKANCLECPGRLGYAIQVFEDVRGLYLVTVRVTHNAWTEPYRDYEFVIGAK